MAELLERVRTALAAQYAVEREIGRGGMATVFVARDLKHPRRVAIKVLHPELAAAVGPERFLRKIEILSGFTHPHILPLLDSGQAGGLLYYVMPFVEGESLSQRLARGTEEPCRDGSAMQASGWQRPRQAGAPWEQSKMFREVVPIHSRSRTPPGASHE
jgi:eukaryotic-like serine/threonine-protein kinase